MGGPLLVGGLGPGPPGPTLNPALFKCVIERQRNVGNNAKISFKYFLHFISTVFMTKMFEK